MEPIKRKTAVYVSNLPLDCTVEEIAETFKKGGVFLLDPITLKPKIKLYNDESGHFKGDALVIYLREESVTLTCQLLDETAFRPDSALMKVQAAVFKEKVKEADPLDQDKKVNMRAHVTMHKQLEWEQDEEKKAVNIKHSKCVILKHMFTLEQLDEDPALLIDLKQDVRDECENIGQVTNVVLFDVHHNFNTFRWKWTEP